MDKAYLERNNAFSVAASTTSCEVEVVERSRLLGRRARELRLDRAMTLREVGEQIGVGANAIQNLEARGVEKISTLEQLAWALGCELVVELRPR